MEQELQSRVLTITKNLSDKMGEKNGVEASMAVEDMKRTDRNGQERDSQVGTRF
jgi:hypothetical protein